MNSILAIALLVVAAMHLGIHMADAEGHPVNYGLSALGGFIALGLAASVLI